MKQIQLERYGQPEEGLRCADVPDVGAPGAGEVVFDVLAFPINPADISFCRGSYRLKPPLPATPGAECVGRVTAVGAGVSHVKPGDWIVQNVANSAVGRLLIRLAGPRGVKTMNVVRRDSLFGELKSLGADACVVDGPDLADAVKVHTREAPIRLGLDAVSGRATARLSACVGEGGVVCNYGSMTGEDPVMSRNALISGGQTLVGFILGSALGTRSLEQVRAIYADLG